MRRIDRTTLAGDTRRASTAKWLLAREPFDDSFGHFAEFGDLLPVADLVVRLVVRERFVDDLAALDYRGTRFRASEKVVGDLKDHRGQFDAPLGLVCLDDGEVHQTMPLVEQMRHDDGQVTGPVVVWQQVLGGVPDVDMCATRLIEIGNFRFRAGDAELFHPFAGFGIVDRDAYRHRIGIGVSPGAKAPGE